MQNQTSMNDNQTESFKIYNAENITVVEMEGSVHQEECDELEELLYGFFENHKKNIVVDLQSVNNICSSALGLLVRFKKFLNDHGGDLKLVINTPEVFDLLKVTMMDKIFDTTDSLQEALNAF